MQTAMNLVCAGGNSLIAVYILWRYSTQRLHRLLALQIGGFAGFSLFSAALSGASSLSAASMVMRYGMLLPYVNLFTFYQFAGALSRSDTGIWKRRVLLVAATLAGVDIGGRLMNLLPPPQLEFRVGQGWFPAKDLPYLWLYTPAMLLLLGGALFLLFRRYRQTRSSLERQNLFIVFAAMGAALVLSSMSFSAQISMLLPLSPLAYTSIVAYGLTRRRLLNLNLLVREGAVAALGSVLLTAAVAVVIVGTMRALNTEAGVGILYLSAALFAVLYPIQYAWTRKLLGRWLGKDIRTSQMLLEYSLLASTYPSFDELIGATLERLVRDHGLSSAAILLPGRGGRLAVYARHPAQDGAPAVELHKEGLVAKALLESPGGLDADSLGWTSRYELPGTLAGRLLASEESNEAVREFLEATRSQACFPLSLRGRLSGVLLVGAPLSGRALLSNELDFFSALSAQLAGMVENSALEGQVQHADRLSTVGMLAASVAHEIRNPLASISVFVQMLAQRHNDGEFMEKFTRLVPVEVDKLNRLTEDLLGLAKPATRAPRVVDLGMLCHREQQLVAHQFRRRQVRFTINAPEGVLVRGVDSQLSQVFLNLVLNALDMSPAGSSVSVELLRRENEAELRTRDEGPGIAADQMQMLFEPFFTTKADGHGLGLATSRRIVESFGGRLEAANAPGGGAEFTVRLPLAQEHSNQVAA
jgi:signal transduction histidine kinase